MLRCVKRDLGRSWAKEFDHVYEFGVVGQSLNKFSSSEFPYNYLSIVSRADYVFVTVAYYDPGDVIKVSMQ